MYPDLGRIDMSKLFKALREGDRLDFFGNDSPKCPHCGIECDVSANDWWQLYEEGEHEVSCPSCDNDFFVSTHVHHFFSTDTQEEV